MSLCTVTVEWKLLQFWAVEYYDFSQAWEGLANGLGFKIPTTFATSLTSLIISSILWHQITSSCAKFGAKISHVRFLKLRQESIEILVTMARPIVISARGSPPHFAATCLASPRISRWLSRVSSPTFSSNNFQASSLLKHSTLIFLRAPICPHTSKERVVLQR
ncbi:hypothetical protein QQP08_018297 [Theobroma cacao]|nr:hypothetical protein QQP08_018297 [Theobroma cacao]